MALFVAEASEARFPKADRFDSFILRTIAEQDLRFSTAAFLVLFGVLKLSQYLFFQFDTSPAVILSPVGISIAAIYLFGYRMWLPLALAWFLGVLTSPANPPVLIAAVAAIAYPLQAMAGGYILKRLKFIGTLERTRCAIILICTALTVPAIAPAIMTGAQWLLGTLAAASPWTSWSRAWAGGVMSVMLLTPLITIWLKHKSRDISIAELLETVLGLLVLGAATYATFWTSLPQANLFLTLYILFAVLMWVALRMRPRITALALFITASFGIAGSILAHPGSVPLNQQLFADELFMIFLAPVFLILAALVDERRVIAEEASVRAQELEKTNRRLSLDDQAKNEFLAILAHELRNPLAPITSSLELIRMKLTELNRPDLLSPVRVAESQGTVLARLLDDLLDISRISRKKFKLQKENTEIHTIIDQALRTIDPTYKAQGHNLTVTVPRNPLWVEADPLRIVQVLVNLLTNAAKYTDPGGAIELHVAHDKHKNALRMSVKDDGEGIEPSMLNKIFEPFVRVNEGKEYSSGLGLGLPLSKRLIELHGGQIWAESTGLGRGSEFIVVLPVSQNVQLSLASLPKERRKAPRKRKAAPTFDILVVDDNKAAAEGICRLLEMKGHTVSVAYDGPSALEKMQEHESEVVLLDIGLPGMDGYAVARELRQEFGYNPLMIVALTGYGQEEDKLKAEQAGFDHHLTKPVGLADIEAALAKGPRGV